MITRLVDWFLELPLTYKVAYIALYAVINAAPMWIMIFTQKNVVRQVTERRKPFQRNDIESWTYLNALVSQFFFIPRFLLLFVYLFIAALGV